MRTFYDEWLATPTQTKRSAGSGIVTAVEAGLAISIFAESGLSPRLRALGPTQCLPALRDFEYVLCRNVKPSTAADRLREVIIDYFRLAAALRRTQTAARARVRSGSGQRTKTLAR
jgi:hypothetical protein